MSSWRIVGRGEQMLGVVSVSAGPDYRSGDRVRVNGVGGVIWSVDFVQESAGQLLVGLLVRLDAPGHGQPVGGDPAVTTDGDPNGNGH